jgi:paired small multidrug resistance pump
MTVGDHEYGKQQWRYWRWHFAVFAVAHFGMAYMFGLAPASGPSGNPYIEQIVNWIMYREPDLYREALGNQISSVWTTIMTIHTLWALWFAFFPKKRAVNPMPAPSAGFQAANKEASNQRAAEKTLSHGRAWVYVLMGGILEIVWAVSFKTGSIGLHTLIAIFASFDLLIRAAKVLPVGTVYAVFAGIGSVGTILAGALYLKEPLSAVKVIFVLLLVVFIIGLKASETRSVKGDG